MADGVIKPMRVDTSLLDGINAANTAAKTSSSAEVHRDHDLLLQRAQVRVRTRRRRSPSRARTTPRSSPARAPACTSTRAATRVTARRSSSSSTTAARITSTAPARTARSSARGDGEDLDVHRHDDRRRARPSSDTGVRADERTKQVEGRAYARHPQRLALGHVPEHERQRPRRSGVRARQARRPRVPHLRHRQGPHGRQPQAAGREDVDRDADRRRPTRPTDDDDRRGQRPARSLVDTSTKPGPR